MTGRVTTTELARMVAGGFQEQRANFKDELKNEIGTLRTELKADIAEIKNTMATKEDISYVRSDINALARRVKNLELTRA